jgi:STAS-like domain of unknown function (DUF4325)
MAAVAEQIIISIAKDFTRTPGARNIDEGAYSGEEFLDKILLPKFLEAIKEKCVLFIDLDDTEGYATSFLEEAFGGLARKYDSQQVLDHIDFKSNDEPLLIEEIKLYIKEAKGK